MRSQRRTITSATTALVVALVTMTALSGADVVLAVDAQAATTRYEAESAPAVCGGVVTSNHSGYSGSGFCDTTNAAGSAVQFTVNSAAAGTATMSCPVRQRQHREPPGGHQRQRDRGAARFRL